MPVLDRFGLPLSCDIDKEAALQAIAHDKKATKDGISTVFVREIGSFEFVEMNMEMLGERLSICTNE